MKRLLILALVAASAACAQTCTRIVDTLYGPGNTALPTVTMRFTMQATVDNGGRTTLPAPLNVTVTAGRLNVCLVPNTYTVDYSTPTTLSHVWVVPTGGPYRVVDVEVSTAPALVALPTLPTVDGTYCLKIAGGARSWITCTGSGPTNFSWAALTNAQWTSMTNSQWTSLTN